MSGHRARRCTERRPQAWWKKDTGGTTKHRVPRAWGGFREAATLGRGLQKALGLLPQRLRQRERRTWQGGEREGGPLAAGARCDRAARESRAACVRVYLKHIRGAVPAKEPGFHSAKRQAPGRAEEEPTDSTFEKEPSVAMCARLQGGGQRRRGGVTKISDWGRRYPEMGSFFRYF